MDPNILTKLRRGALWLLFAVLLLIPKTLGLRRRRRAWNAGRCVVGLLGAALAAAGWAGQLGGWAIAAGALLLILALVVTPEHQRLSVDALAKELGALIVVEGGRYRTVEGAVLDTYLFLGIERLWVLDTSLRPLLEIPLAQITLLRAEPADDLWKLRLVWGQSSAEFFHQGPFAEHFARVAESTVRSQLSISLPILR